MTEQEKNIANNIANKLEIIIQKKSITTLMLSKLLKLDKQPLYRIMKREHIPNTHFLNVIADYLNCSIIELIDDKFFLDILVYPNFDINSNNFKNYRIYIRDDKFIDVADKDLFGIANSSDLKVFYKADSISSDGIYLVYSDTKEITEINILSVGTNLIIAMINGKEERLSHKDIKIIAKLYKTLPILRSNEYGRLLTK